MQELFQSEFYDDLGHVGNSNLSNQLKKDYLTTEKDMI